MRRADFTEYAGPRRLVLMPATDQRGAPSPARLLLSNLEKGLLFVFAMGSFCAAIMNLLLYFYRLSPNYEFHINCVETNYIVSIVQRDGVARYPYVELKRRSGETKIFGASHESRSPPGFYTSSIPMDGLPEATGTIRVIPLAYKYSKIHALAIPRPERILRCGNS